MAAYLIYQAEVTDEDQYAKYMAKTGPSIAAVGGRFVVRGGDVVALEGDAPPGRTVVVEFPTMEVALEWYRGDEYTQIRQLRAGAALARMYAIEGPPPTGDA